MRSSLRQVLFRSATGLDLNFAGGVFSLNTTRSDIPAAIPGWSFSRIGAGTAFDLAGNIIQFATDVPRITNQGILIEEARTNVLLNSATLSTQTVVVAAVAYTLSFYGTGTVTLSGGSTAGPLVGTGANNRVTLTFTPLASPVLLTVTGSVTSAQLEIGSFASSYIPALGATETRSVEKVDVKEMGAVLTMPYVVMVRALAPAFGQSFARAVEVTDGSSNNTVSIQRNSSAARVFVSNGGATVASFNLGTWSNSTTQTVAVRVRSSEVSACFNNGAVSTTACTPASLTQINMGSSPLSAGLWNSPILQARIIRGDMSDAQLQALTAP